MSAYHLLAHSSYSLLEALPSPRDLVEAAARCGMSSLGLVDHRMLTGAVEFTAACRKAGIQSILGLEMDVRYGGMTQRMALIAAGPQGWKNLSRLSSFIHVDHEDDTALDMEQMALFSTDLLAVSPSPSDDPARWFQKLGQIFAGRLYLSMPGPLYPLAETAKRLNLPVVAAPPLYYLQAADAELQRTLTAIRLNKKVTEITAESLAPAGAAFLTPAEIQLRFKDYPKALAGLEEIRERCRCCELPIGGQLYPSLPMPAGKTIAQVLREKAERGARTIYGEITPQIRERLDHELAIISARGYEPIFLIVEEIVDFAQRTGVPISSRGSAASSLVAHCLGITSPDPLVLDLYFERFLNPARSTPPDIDTDICSRRRDSVIAHVFEQYGHERVAMVGTINRFRTRSALGDVAKAHGFSPDKIRELVNTLPYAFFSRQSDDAEEVHTSPFAELEKSHPNPEYQAIFRQADALLKLPRHLSVHPGGLVVGPGALDEVVPLMRSGSKGVTITQLDLDSVEALGLVKIDLLGIRGLTVLGDVAEAIYSWRMAEFRSPLKVLDTIPLDDVPTADRVEKGETIGCFQIESPGMRATLREIRARSMEDLMAALALYRPGPLSGGLRDAFVRRFRGEEVVEHIHPALAPLLGRTFGVILYQEQVLRIANQLAGLSLADADLLRRAMSHFDPGKQMIQLKQRFVGGALEHSGIPVETAERVWEMMAAFAGYGFPQAHAASYAQVAWRSAWCKTHFPAEFLAAVLANWGGYYSQRVYLNEARRLKLDVRPPDVNHSRAEFSVAYLQGNPVLFMGLDQVKDLTRRTINQIIRLRPFASMADFLTRVDPRRQEVESLIRCGTFPQFGSIPALLRSLQSERWQAGQMSLFGWNSEPAEEDWPVEQKMAAQMEILGASLVAHPLELALGKITGVQITSTVEASAMTGQRVTLAGIRQSSHRSRTSKGESMMFLTLEDMEGQMDMILFPDVYRRAKAFIYDAAPMLVTGIVEIDTARGEPLMRVERILRIGVA